MPRWVPKELATEAERKWIAVVDAPIDPPIKRLAVAEVQLAFDVAGVVHGHDVRVLQPRGRLDLLSAADAQD